MKPEAGTTPVWRPPEAYVHGLSGPVAVVPGRVAAWLERHADLRRIRTEARGVDPEVDAVLVALALAAATWRTSATGSNLAKSAEVEAPSALWLTSSQAADHLGIGDRAIRLAIAERRLPAEKVGGQWRINREDIEHYRAARAA